MNGGKYIFSQIVDLVSSTSFQTLVTRHKGDYKVKDFSCWKQFLCMAFGQLTHRESLSDTLMCLKANTHKLYHLGIGELVANSTLARANENRSYLIYEELAMLLIKQAKQLYFSENDLVGGNFFGHSIPNVNFDEILTKNKVALLDYFCIFAM